MRTEYASCHAANSVKALVLYKLLLLLLHCHLASGEGIVMLSRGVYRGGSGCNLRPVCLKGGKNSTLKGEEFPEIYGSY